MILRCNINALYGFSCSSSLAGATIVGVSQMSRSLLNTMLHSSSARSGRPGVMKCVPFGVVEVL